MMKRELRLDSVSCTFSPKVQHQLRTLALEGMPNEVCGLIYPHNIIIQYPNVHITPMHAFDFEAPLDHTIKAMWHSHPGGRQGPSEEDIPCMRLLAEHGFFFPQLIITCSKVLEYRPYLIDLNVMPFPSHMQT